MQCSQISAVPSNGGLLKLQPWILLEFWRQRVLRLQRRLISALPDSGCSLVRPLRYRPLLCFRSHDLRRVRLRKVSRHGWSVSVHPLRTWNFLREARAERLHQLRGGPIPAVDQRNGLREVQRRYLFPDRSCKLHCMCGRFLLDDHSRIVELHPMRGRLVLGEHSGQLHPLRLGNLPELHEQLDLRALPRGPVLGRSHWREHLCSLQRRQVSSFDRRDKLQRLPSRHLHGEHRSEPLLGLHQRPVSALGGGREALRPLPRGHEPGFDRHSWLHRVPCRQLQRSWRERVQPLLRRLVHGHRQAKQLRRMQRWPVPR